MVECCLVFFYINATSIIKKTANIVTETKYKIIEHYLLFCNSYINTRFLLGIKIFFEFPELSVNMLLCPSDLGSITSKCNQLHYKLLSKCNRLHYKLLSNFHDYITLRLHQLSNVID